MSPSLLSYERKRDVVLITNKEKTRLEKSGITVILIQKNQESLEVSPGRAIVILEVKSLLKAEFSSDVIATGREARYVAYIDGCEVGRIHAPIESFYDYKPPFLAGVRRRIALWHITRLLK